MAMNANAPKQINWWVWGGAVAAAIVLIVALGYGFDWFNFGGADIAAPTVEQSAPASE